MENNHLAQADMVNGSREDVLGGRRRQRAFQGMLREQAGLDRNNRATEVTQNRYYQIIQLECLLYLRKVADRTRDFMGKM